MSLRARLCATALSVAAVVPLSSCRHASPTSATGSSKASAAKELEQLSDAYWDYSMRGNPIWATYLADRRFDDQLPDITPEGIQARLDQAKALFKSANEIDPDKLDEEDRVTRDTLLAMLDGEIQGDVCKSELWDVNALDGIQTTLGELPQLHGISAPEHAEHLITRYQKSADWLDQHISNLRVGQQQGYLAAKVAVTRVIEQLDGMLTVAPEQSAFVTSVKLPASFDAKTTEDLQARLLDAVKTRMYPALQRYRDFLQNEYLPEAREQIGVEANRDGAKCYRARILANTHLDLSPERIHSIGLDLAEQNLAEMKAIAKKLTGKEDLAALEAYLAKDPSDHVDSREALLKYADGLIRHAEAKLPEEFGRLPELQVKVKPIEEFREASSPMGYYYSGSEAEHRPGYFYLNTHGAKTVPLYLLQSLTFHESVPGHHLQGAIAQELTSLPKFRRELGDGAYTEGWAHYAELLADELGLYDGDAGRFGMLSDQALRAVRLVVDTGMHHMGWSREKALDYMLTHTAEPRDDAEREIDRYIVWPGQALCYKLGQLEILDLRAEAKKKLGAKFDARAFHDEVLAHGAIPLPVLRGVIERWIERQK